MIENPLQSIKLQKIDYQLKNKSLIENIDTEFNTSQINVILGKNGAGKSTLLALLSKELMPSSGVITWQDIPLNQLSYSQLAQQRAVLPQLQSLVFSFTVKQLVELGVEVQQHNCRDDMNQITHKVMQVCDVLHLANRDVVTLSGGEQKRAQLARVLAQIWPNDYFNEAVKQPFLGRWLLLDEWTNNLDLHHQQKLVKHFKSWAKKGLGIVMVLHDLNLSVQIADKVVLLNNAKLVKQGTVSEVLNVATIQEELGLKVKVVTIEGIQHPVILPAEMTS
ncbi:ATP-binding cassette domain-containing protein [Thiomicrorhabdus sp. Kp2]|uniref:ATP-binding cassette domain-containing protein n=1 Tax=Thiomicrorhabdus sp. Kp2 TaxID=1123518 RepID=UPI000401C68C|nr:ATP-binding cassette domain-containing protein [Thiomicrorhabdus sp. Kp2]